MKPFGNGALFVVLIAASVASSAQAANYLFIGTYAKSDKGVWCADVGLEKQALDRKQQYRETRKAFYKAHQHRLPFTKLLGPDEAAVVYRYRARSEGFGCEHQVVGIEPASDVEAAKAKVSAKVEKNPKIFLSPPEYLVEWSGSEYKARYTRSYDGVEMTFISRKGKTGKAVLLVQGRNTNKDMAAAVSLFPAESDIGPLIFLAPGESFNKTFQDADRARVAVQLYPPEAKDSLNMDEVIDRLKHEVRDQVQMKDGKVKSERFTCMCVRG